MKKRAMRMVGMLIVLTLFTGIISGCGQAAKPGDQSQTSSPAKSGTPAADLSSPSSSEAAKEVKIGFVWPLTGGSATIGQQHDAGARWAIEEINKNGGIKSMGGAKIVPIVADSETKPDVGCTQVERLILKEGVSAVVGCYNSNVTFPASEVAQRNKTPFFSMGGVKNEITERGYEWIVRINNKAEYDIKEMFTAIDLFEKQTGEKVKTASIIYEATDWGSDSAKVITKFCKERNIEVLVDEPVTTGQSDMTAQVLKLKKANADVIFNAFYTPEMILFLEACAANKVNPRLGHWTTGGGAQDPAFYAATKPEISEYIFIQEDWDAGGPKRFDWIAELDAQVREKNGYPLNSFFAQGWTAAYVAYTTLEIAGSADKDAIREATKKVDLKKGEGREILTGYTRIKFDENGQNTYSHGTIVQRVNNTNIGLSPECNADPGAKPVWPIPDWGSRPEVTNK